MPRKTVAIRGLDTELYHEVFSMAKKDGKRVADVVNIALKAFIERDYEELPGNMNPFIDDIDEEDFVLSIDDEGQITLSKDDIMDISNEMGPFTIQTSGDLTFEKDVDKEAMDRVNGVIVKSGNVKVPKNCYALLLMKSQISGLIDKY
jgi:hypothetical protein